MNQSRKSLDETYGDDSSRVFRYGAALVLLFYGFAKINGSQFTILNSELDKPMGQVSGFWLTWYYFGYSAYYGNFVAMTQIAGALLLTFRRTTLLGACALTPVLINIVLIDVCYGIDAGAALLALLLLTAMIWLISRRGKDLLTVFWRLANARTDEGRMGSRRVWAIRLVMLGAAFGFTYWAANYNNRVATPLDGIWDVVQAAPHPVNVHMPKTIFFERNRAYMSVFKTENGLYETHHFEIDRRAKQIRLWQEWLSKKDLIFTGTYSISGSELILEGAFYDLGDVRLRLHRRSSA